MKIGKIFKEFRVGKNITLVAASEGIVSVPFLSRFERGLTDISFTHLLQLLNRINVQLSEFEFLYQEKNTGYNDLLSDFQIAYQNGNIKQLQQYLKMWQEKPGKYANLQVIQLKMMLTTLGADKLSEGEIKSLEGYFQNIKSWTFFELYLFGHAIPFLNKTFMFNLFRELQKKEIIYDNFRNDSFSMLFYIYNNVILFLLSGSYLDEAELLVTKLESYFIDHDKDYYHKTRIFNLKGLVLYLKGDKEKGLPLIKRANVIAYLTNQTTSFLNNEKRYLENYLTKAEIEYAFDFSDILNN